MSAVIRVEAVSKRYRLGMVNRRMLYEDLQSRWAKFRGKPDPNARIDARGGGGHGDLWALRDVSFEVNDGDVLGVIGHNGSGKSTLLKILSQITAPTSGRALVKGHIASLLEVGTGFHPELTGRDNVFLNGVILGMRHDEIARKFDEIVAFSGVEQFIDTPVKRYSSGMRVRLAFAVAANLDPEILVIDEVLAVGDQSFQQKCLGKIGEVARGGRTVLFVSHQAAAVENLCTRGLVLENGRLIFEGTQTEALHHYAQRSDSEVVGSSLLARRDRTGVGGVRVVAIEFRDTQGRPIKNAPAGRDLDIYLHFEKAGERDLPRLNCVLRLRTEFDAPVFSQHNALHGVEFGSLPARGAFVCRVKRLPLPASTYRLNYTLTAERRGSEVLDSITHAADLHVVGADFYGTGELPPISVGVCLVDADWRLEPSPEIPQL